MSSTDDMDARHGRMLAELAEAGMGVARSLYAATQAAPVSNADFALLAEAFHTVSRSIRQTIALEFKLKHAPREPAAPKPEPKPAPPPPTPPAAPGVRPEQVYWNEYERADWAERLDDALDAGDADAVSAAIEASVACIQRGLTKAERVLATTNNTSGCHPALGAAQDRDPNVLRPKATSCRRSGLLTTSSHRGPGLRVPRNRDDAGGGGGTPRPPPWRGSG
jgi:type IV secretory pathway VirB10-like protein